jgi:hypothetical protein
MLFVPVAGYEHGVLIGGNLHACLQARQVPLFTIKVSYIFVHFPSVYVCLVSRYCFFIETSLLPGKNFMYIIRLLQRSIQLTSYLEKDL